MVVAGSETTATLLSAAIYFLARNPHTFDRLTREVRGAFTERGEIGLVTTPRLRYMQAVLDEALRMYPPVAGGGAPRKVAKGGVCIAGYCVPENVSFPCSTRAIQIRHKHGRDVCLTFVPKDAGGK